MVDTITANIFETDCDIIGCQVNCAGLVNSGFALKVKSEYPEVYKKYFEIAQTSSRDNNLLGTVSIVPVNDKLSVALMFCQDGFYARGRYTDWPSLKKCLEYIHDNFTDKRVAYPYLIGCKPYCGKNEKFKDWKIVNDLINYIYKDDGEVVIYKDEVDPLEEFEAQKKLIKERMRQERLKKQEERAKELENM